MKKILFSLAIMMTFMATYAQVPTVMMYQVQIKHGKAAAQDVSVEMQLRTSQNGSAIWNQIFDLKDVNNGSVQNLGLNFGSKVDLANGEYWLATIVDGDEKGCAKLTSVPYAMVAKKVEGALTAEELIGTWAQSRTEDNETIETKFTFKSDGTFTYSYCYYYKGTLDDKKTGSGIWKLNGVGNLYVNGTRNSDYEEGTHEENVVTTYLDRVAGTLTIGAGDSYFFGDVCNLTKVGNGSNNGGSGDINNGDVKSEFIGKWIGTITDGEETFPGTLICNSDGTYEWFSEAEGVRSFSGTWSADDRKLYLTGFFEEFCSYTMIDNMLYLKGTGWTGSFKKSTTR